jgi:hypothetical protein
MPYIPNFRATGMNEKVFYTSDELLEIFKEQHRLCSQLDPIADETFVLTRETKIWELRDAQDLVPWEEYSEFLNQEFKIDVPVKKWKLILNPDDTQTLGDLCDFLSTVAKKETVKPIKRLGAECLSAAIFLTLKRNLRIKGVNVADLRPSTRIEDFLDNNKNFSSLIEEVTLTGLKTFDKLEYGKLRKERWFKYWIDKIFPNWVYRRPINAGDIHTFRDLVERIMDNKKLGMHNLDRGGTVDII